MAVSSLTRVSGCSDQRRQLGQRPHLAVGETGQALAPLRVAVAPDHLHSERRSGIGIPGVRGLKCNCVSWHLESVHSELIDPGIRLVDPDFLHREHGIEQPAELKKQLFVEFEGEQGHDEGEKTDEREWEKIGRTSSSPRWTVQRILSIDNRTDLRTRIRSVSNS